jgi:hypothetical protein
MLKPIMAAAALLFYYKEQVARPLPHAQASQNASLRFGHSESTEALAEIANTL